MLKSKAIEVLGGGSPRRAAAQMRITASAVSQWPERLPPSMQDRVLAALARRHLPASLLEELGVGGELSGKAEGCDA